MDKEPAEIDLLYWISRAKKAEIEAHSILAKHERSISSRVVYLEELVKKVSTLPVDILNYFNEAVICIEYDLRRASIVMAWAGFFSVFSEKLYSNKEQEVRNIRKKWTFSDLDELKAKYGEAAIIDVSKEVGIIKRGELKILQGLLSKRNQCAHPTLYSPSINETIGYVDELINKTKIYL